MKLSFNHAAKTYDANVDIQNVVAQFVAAQAQQHIKPAHLALDIGCGTGRLAQLLPNHSIIGVDAAENMCVATSAICADALALPFNDTTIAAAISSLSWQWLPLPKSVAELARILQPNATAIIGTLSHGTMHELQHVYHTANITPRMLRYHTSEQIAEAFQQNGFNIVHHHRQRNILQYPSAWAFFKQLQLIGASRATNLPPLKPAQLKQLAHIYEMQHEQINVTYHWDCLTMKLTHKH